MGVATMKRRAVLRLIALAGVASLAAACQSPVPIAREAPSPTPLPPLPAPTVAPTEITAGPGIRVAIDQDPDTLDPAGQMNPTTSSIVEHLAETLVRLQPDGSVAPGLARKFSQAKDGKSYTFELRPDVEFHDGGTLDAEAAALSLKRFLDPQLRVATRAPFDSNLVDSIAPLDPLTLRINLKDRPRLFLQRLAAA